MELVTDDIADFVEIVVGCKIVVAVVVDIVDSQTVVVAAVSIAVVVLLLWNLQMIDCVLLNLFNLFAEFT